MLKEKILTRSVRMICASGVAVGLGFAAQPALSQEAVQRVEITGSAIKRIDAETSVPVTVLKMDDLRKQGITSVEQILASVSAMQIQTGSSQVIGSGTGGASFADMRGLGQNKTLVLLNGRRIANNSIDGSAPDMNMIPFAAIERVEVLRDGASALYGTDAISGVINFITRNDFTGGTLTINAERPAKKGGRERSVNIGGGFGDLEKNGFNIFGFIDLQKQDRIGGLDRDFNKRYPGGLSSNPFPANYYQDAAVGNPAAPACNSNPNITPNVSDTGACKEATATFVNYTPKSERSSAFLKGTLKLNENHQLGLEYFYTKSIIDGQIAPVPYGGLYMNRLKPDGSPNPFYPGNPGAIASTVVFDPAFDDGSVGNVPGVNVKPGFIYINWRDLFHGNRNDINTNTQQRFVVSMDGVLAGWDYRAGVAYNQNKVQVSLKGYSDGDAVQAGMLDGVLNPFGDQTAAGTALLKAAALSGSQQIAKTTAMTVDAHASKELSDWFNAGHKAAVAVGASFGREKLHQAGDDLSFNTRAVASTGFDPATLNEGKRNISALYTEFNVPVLKSLDITAAVRYDRYSDFGSTTNPKIGFRFQPNKEILLRGSVSTGFRAPSLYDLHSAQSYTNTTSVSDPVNCPGGNVIPGKSAPQNCDTQFMGLTGGNMSLNPEKSKSSTIGLVFEPAKDLSFGIDLWAVTIKDSIGSVPDTSIFSDAVTFGPFFHRNANGNLSTTGSACPGALCGYVDLRQQNLGGTKTNGVDLSGNYRLSTSMGKYVFGVQSTYVNKYEYQDYANGPWNQNVGIFVGTGPIFKWTNNLNLNWTMGEFSAGLAGHLKSGYVDQVKAAHPGHLVDSYATYDAFGSWAPIKAVSIVLGVHNMFDKAPPLSYQTVVFQSGYDARFASPVGRSIYLRGTYNF